MKMHKKFKSCFAVMTSAVCLSTALTGMTASALNSTNTVSNLSQTQVRDLSETVYTFSDTDINLVLPNNAMEQNLTKYSYSSTNVAGNKNSIGFAITATKDLSQCKATVTNRLICNSILGELYNLGYTTVYAEPHGGTDVGNQLIPVYIIKQRDNYTPRVLNGGTSENGGDYVIPLDISRITDSSSSTEFYELIASDGERNLSGYFTTSSSCSMKMYNGRNVTLLSDSRLLVGDRDLCNGCKLYKYTVDNSGKVTNVTSSDFNIMFASPKMDTVFFNRIEPYDSTIYEISGGSAAALPKGYYWSVSYSMKSGYGVDGSATGHDGLRYPASHSPQVFDKEGYFVPGWNLSQYLCEGLSPNTHHDPEMYLKMISDFGYDNYCKLFRKTNPVEDIASSYKNLAYANMDDLANITDSSTGKIVVSPSKKENFYAISPFFAKDRVSDIDSSKKREQDGKYASGLQALYTSKEDYKYPVISNYEDDEFLVDSLKNYTDKSIKKMFDAEGSDYFVEFLNGKMTFVTHDSSYRFTTNGLVPIREVVTDYLGDADSYNIVSEEKRDCIEDARRVNVTTSSDSGNTLFLPDCTYELADGTDLVRVRLMDFTKTKVYEEYEKTDSANGIEGKVFIYDSSYSTPAAAYEAGACYIVDNGDYDVLLPVGNYTISALGTFTGGAEDVDTEQLDIGSFTKDYRDVDMDDLQRGITPDITFEDGKTSTVSVNGTYNVPIKDTDLRDVVGNAGKVGGIKSIELSETQPVPVASGTTQIKSGLPEGIELKDGVLTGTPKEAGVTTANVTITAGNDTTLELQVKFDIAKAIPNVDVSIPDKDYTAGDDLPDLIIGKDTPEGKVSWVVDEIKKLTEGENNLPWEYTPDDDNYAKVTGTIVVNAKVATTTTTVTTDTTGGTSDTASSGTIATTKATADVGSRLYGDVNLDGAVDIADAVLLNKAIAGAVMLNDQSRLNSDCHADDTLETNDSIALLQFLVHTINTLPVTD